MHRKLSTVRIRIVISIMKQEMNAAEIAISVQRNQLTGGFSKLMRLKSNINNKNFCISEFGNQTLSSQLFYSSITDWIVLV